MMHASSESPLKQARAYRDSRRAFIAACEMARLDPIARFHPATSPDAKPLFMDCVAIGPRHAGQAVLVVAATSRGSKILTQLVRKGLTVPDQTRVVLVHGFDPASFAGTSGDPGWPNHMIAAVATEDLSRAHRLGVMALEPGVDPRPGLVLSLPNTQITMLPVAISVSQARSTITKFLLSRL